MIMKIAHASTTEWRLVGVDDKYRIWLVDELERGHY